MLLRLSLLSALTVGLFAGPSQQTAGAQIEGRVVSRQDGASLPGAAVTVLNADGQTVAQAICDDSGRFRIGGLAPGLYRITASFVGFQDASRESVQVSSGQRLDLELSLELAELAERVEVSGTAPEQQTQTAAAKESLKGELINVAPVRGDEFTSLLPLLPGVLRGTDGRLILKGGRPTQSSLVVNSSSNVTDPATGDQGFNLPVDAVERVDVLPNPYSPEFGRFSSSITNILTRQGTNQWKYTINNFLPRPKFRDDTLMGIGGFTPRLGFRGPVVKDRLFFAQTFQYRFLKTEIPSLPSLESDTRLESFSSFTQFDANLNDRHALSTVVSVFPRRLNYVNLDTFNPQGVTPNLHQRGYNIGLSERFVISPSSVLESTVSFKRFDVDVFGQGFDDMIFAPDVNQGNYFNLQRRKTRTLQWVEQLSVLREGWGGQHLLKFGVDLLAASFDGLSQSRPIDVRRADGSLGQRILYSDPSSQRERNTDLAIYAQDRWRPNDRLLLELGVRVDRDGVLDRTNLAPRVGFVFALEPDGRSVVKGGAGLFYDRTPLSAAAFEDYERPTVEQYDRQGDFIQARTFELNRADEMRTAYSVTWNFEFNRRLAPWVFFKTNFLHRRGFHELILDPLFEPAPQLRLDSRGRSRYWEWEFTTRVEPAEGSHLIFSYVRSESKRDLNGFDEFYGNFRNPIVRPNEYSQADTDVPHRFLLQGTLKLFDDWLFSPLLEVRSGFPFSIINEDRDFLGTRNRAGRFRTLTSLDVDVQRWFTIRGMRMRIGFRVFNVLGTFNPRDVQNNVDSSLFGTFFNTRERKFGGTLQLEP